MTTRWEPISLAQLLELVGEAEREMAPAERRLWHLARVTPAKWQLSPWGDQGGGFWVVGVVGQAAIWFNDIEYGFNVSPYSQPGTLNAYGCDQGSLQVPIFDLLKQIVSGSNSGYPGASGPA